MAERLKDHPDTCQVCGGRGQTKRNRTIVKRQGKRFVTTQMGSGCWNCGGTGRKA